MKRVVSVSLGSSKRNKASEFEILGEKISLERIGTDGDLDKFASLFSELDGKVDAFGIGGADLFLVAGDKRYTFHQINHLIQGAKLTPVVDGSGLKHTLERETIFRLQNQGVFDFANEKVLLMSAVDRFGMADALFELCPDVVCGDLMFGLGLPFKVRSKRAIDRIGKTLLPIVTALPFKWFYPTGEKQDERKPAFPRVFAERTIIAGDSLYILRYAPDSMSGKSLITQSIRSKDLEFLKGAGVKTLVTTTPVIGGETFATNVIQAAMVAYLGRDPDSISAEEYLNLLDRMNWNPTVLEL